MRVALLLFKCSSLAPVLLVFSQYVVDSSSTRHIIDIGMSKKENYSKGGNQFVFSAPKIDITGRLRGDEPTPCVAATALFHALPVSVPQVFRKRCCSTLDCFKRPCTTATRKLLRSRW
jgi:hypothetical protein